MSARRLFVVASTVTAVALTACSQAPEAPRPPEGFPDLSAFTALDPDDSGSTLPHFTTPKYLGCAVDFGESESIVCSGHLPGLPESTVGTGCTTVRRADSTSRDAPYVFAPSGCAPSKAMQVQPGRKIVGEKGICALGEDGLVACIDADFKHGFVLQPSGSWVF